MSVEEAIKEKELYNNSAEEDEWEDRCRIHGAEIQKAIAHVMGPYGEPLFEMDIFKESPPTLLEYERFIYCLAANIRQDNRNFEMEL